IEVKSARIKQSGINDLFDTEASVAQLRRLSNFGVQAYSTLSDALSGDYPHWKPDGLPVYLMVVTLEDWHTVGIQVQREVVEPIRERLSEKGLSPRLPDDFPFIYASSADLGAMLHVANKVSLETVLNKKTSGEFMQWQLGVFLQTAFQDEIQGYRPSAFDPAWNEIV
ncbi:MAG TPA: hypothetical protein VHN58_07250, partial [Croceicoccus sp.]|nr:hypothetical protein [Croceicoccus sp.]